MKNIKSEKIYNSLAAVVLLVIVLLMPSQMKADLYDYEYSLGIAFTTSKILGDNPAINTLRPINSSVPGGSFNGAMPGVEVKGQYKLDDVGDWRLVGGVNYTFYSAREKFPGDISIFRLSHSLNILSPLVGINYTIFRFPSAMSSFYAGIEARYNYVHASEFILNETSRINDEFLSERSISKESAGRVGGLVKLGIEGEISDNYMINVSWGIDVLNALGRDNDRGQLLTPYSTEVLVPGLGYELEEELTYNFYFSLMIQYRLD
jgi:hypothetical protein